MAKQYKPADLSKLNTYCVGDRSHKFDVARMAKLPPRGATFRRWWDSLPPFLGAAAITQLARAIVDARAADRPVVFALGAHAVKVGCSPIICDLIKRGIISAVAMNGATAIHDVEVATIGETSEEVGDTILDGSFGMVEETPAFFAEALSAARDTDQGLGAAIGDHLLKVKAPNRKHSILATARRAGIPVTVHVAIGTDTIHMHAAVARSDLAGRSTVDFRIICSVLADLAPASRRKPAGVWCNVGSAVLLPEVFLKALAVARNLGSNLDDITTANLDMIRHYRPSENVIGRPVKKGKGLQITGHHEIMLPLLRQALIELAEEK
ncbi:MAG: hypothetical protein ABII12_04365 [Planctomycetota bacterium]